MGAHKSCHHMPQRLALHGPAGRFPVPANPAHAQRPPASHAQGPRARGSPTAQACGRSQAERDAQSPASRVTTSLGKAEPSPGAAAARRAHSYCLLHNIIYSADGNLPKSRRTELLTNPLTTIFTRHQLQFLKIQRWHCIMFYFNLLKIEPPTGAAICC